MKSLYQEYQHLLGVMYDDGRDDCYGLARRYYKDLYGIDMPDYARGPDFFHAGIDIISSFLKDTEFRVTEVPVAKLQKGDGLLLVVPSRNNPNKIVNHIAVYAGNGHILHHLYEKVSTEDPLSDNWKNRVAAVLRHPDVTAKNEQSAERLSIMDVLPDHVKQRINLATESNVGTDGGAVRADPPERESSGAKKRTPRARKQLSNGEGTA